MSVHYIPIGVPFLKCLVDGLLRETHSNPELLADIHLLLPTRRACREITDLFLDACNGKPVLLPKIHAIGDVDDQELELLISAEMGDIPDICPAISNFDRQISLAEFVRVRHPDMDFTQAYKLAGALASFLDRVQNEGLDMDKLDQLVAEEFAKHWQITLDFLNVIRTVWPAYLDQMGFMDSGVRRVHLINLLSSYWAEHPPKNKIIIAGVTGSLPCIAHLMSVVSRFENGQVIFSGFDPEFNWDQMDVADHQHPYTELACVFHKMDISHNDISRWAWCDHFEIYKNPVRAWFLRTIMMSPSATHTWTDLSKNCSDDFIYKIKSDLKKIDIVECAHVYEESLCVALKTRSILQNHEKTVAIVTPDRSLAYRIKLSCERFDIQINDSAGVRLSTTRQAQFFLMLVKIAANGFSAVDLISLLRHELLCGSFFTPDSIDEIDTLVLCGFSVPEKPDDFIAYLKKSGCKSLTCELFDVFLRKLTPLFEIQKNSFSFIERINVYAHVFQDISIRDGDKYLVWDGDVGSCLADIIQNFTNNKSIALDIEQNQDLKFLKSLFDDSVVNIKYFGHPRVALFGVFESRLLSFDHVILCGFNEGVWPERMKPDPWFSRLMSRDFGFPASEVSVGRMALDVVNLCSVSNVTITRSVFLDHAPTQASRWIERMDTVLSALKIEKNSVRNHTLVSWSRDLDFCGEKIPAFPVFPSPDLDLRPKKISATQFETLVQNPYVFYVQKILKLSPRDEYDKDIDSRSLGVFIHYILECSIKNKLFENEDKIALHLMMDMFVNLMKEKGIREKNYIAILPRMYRTFELFLEENRKINAKNGSENLCEVEYEADIQGMHHIYKLTSCLDRILFSKDDGAHIFDYKTGQLPARKDVNSGLFPQLPIQYYLAAKNCKNQITSVSLWPVSYRRQKIISWLEESEKEGLKTWREKAHENIINVLDYFHDIKNGYPIIQRPKLKKFDRYLYLMRQDERVENNVDEE